MKRLLSLSRATVLGALILLLSACGQSGPLYLPGNPSKMAVPPEDTTGEEEDKDEADSSEAR